MIIGFEIENVSGKEADDIAIQVMEFIIQELEFIVTEYWVELE